MRTAYYKQRAIAKACAQTMAHEINSFATSFADIVRRVEKILAQRESRVSTNNKRYELAKEIKTILRGEISYPRTVDRIEQTLVEWYREGKLQLGPTTDSRIITSTPSNYDSAVRNRVYDKEPMWKQEAFEEYCMKDTNITVNPCSEIKLGSNSPCSLDGQPNGINLFDSDATRINHPNFVQVSNNLPMCDEVWKILKDIGWEHKGNSWFYNYE